MSVHVLGHVARMPAVLRSERGPGGGRRQRRLALAGALVAGLVLATLLAPRFHVWT